MSYLRVNKQSLSLSSWREKTIVDENWEYLNNFNLQCYDKYTNITGEGLGNICTHYWQGSSGHKQYERALYPQRQTLPSPDSKVITQECFECQMSSKRERDLHCFQQKAKDCALRNSLHQCMPSRISRNKSKASLHLLRPCFVFVLALLTGDTLVFCLAMAPKKYPILSVAVARMKFIYLSWWLWNERAFNWYFRWREWKCCKSDLGKLIEVSLLCEIVSSSEKIKLETWSALLWKEMSQYFMNAVAIKGRRWWLFPTSLNPDTVLEGTKKMKRLQRAWEVKVGSVCGLALL